MSTKVSAELGRRVAKGGPAGRGPSKTDGPRGTTAKGKLVMPARRLRLKSPPGKFGSTGPGKGSRAGLLD